MNIVRFINIDTDDIVAEIEAEAIDTIEMFINAFQLGDVGYSIVIDDYIKETEYISHEIKSKSGETSYNIYFKIKINEAIGFLH